jgi:murein DD-endopeptidase MepM/ murein hydrolase activator NlpD
VLAVADGIVADARDDMAESPAISGGSRTPIPLEAASGNYVTLDLGGGRFAFYEHLAHGSVRVRPGERVARGQVIGRLGNSGSSSAGPHLHFHVSDANAALAAEGLPYVFRSFEVLGAFDTIQAVATGMRWKPAAQGAGGRRTMELPAANTVIVFGSEGARDGR